ncbi:MAG: FHA domain-containing protein, partial [Zetaproteobacteria bacterium]|nr:FHA domain-containing protein [Zetaproteobacteria bacterium]
MKKLQIEFELPGQSPRAVVVDQSPYMIGSLSSSQLVLQGAGVEPLHALLEYDNNVWTVTDLGSAEGVKLNGTRVEVVSPFKVGDSLEVGAIKLSVKQVSSLPADAPVDSPEHRAMNDTSVQVGAVVEDKTTDKLFTLGSGKSVGNVLEVVSYWHDTVLEVEHFHPKMD